MGEISFHRASLVHHVCLHDGRRSSNDALRYEMLQGAGLFFSRQISSAGVREECVAHVTALKRFYNLKKGKSVGFARHVRIIPSLHLNIYC